MRLLRKLLHLDVVYFERRRADLRWNRRTAKVGTEVQATDEHLVQVRVAGVDPDLFCVP